MLSQALTELLIDSNKIPACRFDEDLSKQINLILMRQIFFSRALYNEFDLAFSYGVLAG